MYTVYIIIYTNILYTCIYLAISEGFFSEFTDMIPVKKKLSSFLVFSI